MGCDVRHGIYDFYKYIYDGYRVAQMDDLMLTAGGPRRDDAVKRRARGR